MTARKLKWYHWIPFFWLDTVRGEIQCPNWIVFWLYMFYQGLVSATLLIHLVFKP